MTKKNFFWLVSVLCITLWCQESLSAKDDARTIRNKLFKYQVLNKKHDAIYHDILQKINLGKDKKIPGIALCSIKRTDSNSKNDREMFIKAVAAVLGYVNKIIMEHRACVLTVHKKNKEKVKLTEQEEQTFSMICSFYQSKDIDVLLKRVAPVPISLAVAQASLESGFGSSPVMHKNNAFFGMMLDKTRLLPFDTLFESAIAYAKTLNVHSHYKAFRESRDKMLCRSQVIDGAKLSETIEKYCEKKAYKSRLLKLMKEYNLMSLDRAYTAA
ncbi:MAG: glucosaminidase domain-containing protein [Holosporaceae bacterium]|jgi:Bax protein|nr:glucosaminidase domain-containing protein [Holosporaceae bacterium]